MSMLRIVLNHLKQRRLKTALLGVALALGIATVVAMITLVAAMRLELGNELDKFGPNIVIMPRYEDQTLFYGGDHYSQVAFELKPLTESDIDRIRTIQDRESLNIISPKLVGPVQLNGQSILLVGLENEAEFTMKPWFKLAQAAGVPQGEALMEVRELDLPRDGLILGSQAAAQFELTSGETAFINGQAFIVSGILKEAGGDEDGLVFADLGAAQALLQYEDAFSMIEVSGFCNFCPIEDMASQITDILPNAKVTALRQAALVRQETIDRFAAFGRLLSIAALALTVLFGISTMLSAVNERTPEIGVLRAIGFRRSLIIRIIFLEALLVSLAAGLIGFVGGTLLAGGLGPFLSQTPVPVVWDFRLLGPAVILSAGLGTISSLYPALKAARLDPVESIRHI